MGKVVRVVIMDRHAYLFAAPEALEKLDEYWSFSAKAAHWHPAHKLWLRKKAEAMEDGAPVDDLPGWDGRIRFLKKGVVTEGLFRATCQEAERDLGIRFRTETGGAAPAVRIKKLKPLADARYSYQDDCIRRMTAAIPTGGGLIISATGTGKTSTAGRFFLSVPDMTCLFVVDTVDLLYQAQQELAQWTGEDVGAVGNAECVLKRITVATRQTLYAQRERAMFRKWFGSIGIVIVDEIHEQMSKKNFDLIESIRPVARFGLTATLQLKKKEVRLKAFSFAGPVLFDFPLSEGAKRHVLTEAKAIQLLFPEEYDYDPPDYRTEYAGEVQDNLTKREACHRIARHLTERGRYVMTLTWRREHTWALSESIGIPHRVTAGEVSKDLRQRARAALERGRIRLLISSGVSKKGTNLKRVDVLMDMAEMKSANDTQQKLGRGVRLHPDKTGLLYIDFGTATGRFRKAARARLRAIRALGVPVKQYLVSTPGEALDIVRRLIP